MRIAQIKAVVVHEARRTEVVQIEECGISNPKSGWAVIRDATFGLNRFEYLCARVICQMCLSLETSKLRRWERLHLHLIAPSEKDGIV